MRAKTLAAMDEWVAAINGAAPSAGGGGGATFEEILAKTGQTRHSLNLAMKEIKRQGRLRVTREKRQVGLTDQVRLTFVYQVIPAAKPSGRK